VLLQYFKWLLFAHFIHPITAPPKWFNSSIVEETVSLKLITITCNEKHLRKSDIINYIVISFDEKQVSFSLNVI